MRGGKLVCVVAAMLLSSVICAKTAHAQQQPYRADTSEMMIVSAASLDNIVRRIDALESNVENDVSETGVCKEVDIIEKPTQKWSGRVHFDYWPFPTDSPLANFLETGDPATGPRDLIAFRRLRFGVRGDVNETMEYKIEMEFAAPNLITFKDAFLGWNKLPMLQTVLLGNQKRPYGLAHLNSSRYSVFMERPFHVEAFNQDARRFGLQSHGVSDNEQWNWRYGCFLMDDLARTGGQRSDDYESELAGRLANTVWYDEVSDGRGYAHWAMSGSAAFPGGGPNGRFTTRPEARTARKWIDTGVLDANTYQLIGLEGVLNIGAFSVVGEYQIARVQRSGAPDLEFGGGYVYVAHFLTGEHTPWSRNSGILGRTIPFENFFMVCDCDGNRAHGWGAWQVAARYSHGDFSDHDVFGGVGDSFTFGMNWWWNPNARMQFNYIHGNISDRVVAGAPDTQGWYNIFGARFMVDF